MAQAAFDQSTQPQYGGSESEFRLDLALRAAQIGIWDWDLRTDRMEYTPRAREIFGFGDNEEITLDRVRGTTHPDDATRTRALARRSLDPAIRERSPYEYRIRRANTGEVRWVLAFGEPIFAEENGISKAVRYVGTVQDITDRKAAEHALRESETRLRLAIDASKMAVWEVDLATDEVSKSKNLNRIFGFPEEYTPTLDELRMRYAPGERERVQKAGRAAMDNGMAEFEIEYECVRLDGQRRWLLLRAEIIRKPDGTPTRVIGVLADIDDKKRTAEQQKLILGELNHRMKNTLAVVQSVVSQTFRDEKVDPDILRKCRERIHALASANDVLVHGNWSHSDLGMLVAKIIEPFHDRNSDAFKLDGPDLQLPSAMNVPLAMTLHELSTNAVKYGALSRDGGQVEITWRGGHDGAITIDWRERGGPKVRPPAKTGFGSRLLEKGLSSQLGRIDLDYRPDGLLCSIQLSTLENGATTDLSAHHMFG
ncbi:sensor histidine kinase [Oricola cellulosilytica]|uniref:Blue-light-activated histidine kinase n=1 Tax=Oricola cellulosilytica TaxID=1429082 RepID=A0A4R0PC99_9HYPH|nr:sensor histidine kinase [Oricola cellulosilytica]TCD14153.1 PAS domain S-box protein [Oricola cellulosilytica]